MPLPRCMQGDSEIPGHIIALAVQQIVRELQRQAPQGEARSRALAWRGFALALRR